jgi:hypothetical protein
LEVVEIWGKWREHKGASSILVMGCFKKLWLTQTHQHMYISPH